MNAPDRSAVVTLLNYLASKYLHTSNEVRATAAHFNVTLTVQHEKAERPFFNASDDTRNYVVDVFRPNAKTIHGERYDFATAEEADFFAATQRGEILVKDQDFMMIEGVPAAITEWKGHRFIDWKGKTHRFADLSDDVKAAIDGKLAPEPDAIPLSKARELFKDSYSIDDAHAVGKHYVVGICPASLEGKLIKHGTYFEREHAMQAMQMIPQTRGIDIERCQLVVLQK
ncbi:hypothetical protein PQA73_gp62 [Erwinia phage Pavtok]|uniref:Uncharacterized protein n=1 Tax=Erwinia phage Pavtok TaxID=2267655 RepID=A0A345BM19_9CAUD|nr:hypothetical protein PQA73_gp62 [Erwinia phage Pavtok]AXF51490.1 hypothetical protein PAVTOK_62 [Erwinia phage Pavtok]